MLLSMLLKAAVTRTVAWFAVAPPSALRATVGFSFSPVPAIRAMGEGEEAETAVWLITAVGVEPITAA